MSISIVKPSMTAKAINKVLALGGEITFKAGDYRLSDTLILCSESDITCEKGVVLHKTSANKLIRTKVTAKTKKYNGAHDISWTGGTFVTDNNTPSNVMELIHAKDITIKNVTFQRGVGRHFIEIHASSDIHVVGCTFDNLIPESGKEYKEAIQIDFSNYDGLQYAEPTAVTYDGTHCSNIDIEQCKFSRCTDCIGTHTVTTLDKQHKHINIRNNIADGSGIFLKLANMSDVNVTGNKLRNFSCGVKSLTFKTGHKVGGGTSDSTTNKNTKITIKGNVFDNVDCDVYVS